jgi:CheY-like chemotaxis protein
VHKEVFIVDDDRDLRDSLRDVLEDFGYHVQLAANGAEALERLRSGTVPCLILLDLMMPVMGGAAFCAERAADAALRQIPVVIFSAVVTASDGWPPGVDAVMGKPVDLNALIAVVQRYCGAA